MRIETRLVPIGLSVLLLAGTSSCALLVAGAAGGATAAWVMGDLEADLPASPQKVVKESVKVLEDMDMHVSSSDSTSVDGKVEAKTALDKKVTIIVKSRGDAASQISIRVGPFGDEAISRKILDGVKARL